MRKRKAFRKADGGFTLAELMIALSLIGILTAVVVPKVGQMIQKANEAATIHKLNAIRAALSIYYTDLEGEYPGDLSPLLTPGSKYLTGVFPVYTQIHGNGNDVTYYASSSQFADNGTWGYSQSGTTHGEIWVNCTHTDLKGKVWSRY